jgi:SAM-dependent methyltransferase
MKTDAFNFFNKQYTVDRYTELYKKLKFKIRYPANVKRLQIIIDLLKQHKPKKILDAGCGAGMPLIEIKKRGFDIYGYDKAKNMILEAKENLKNNKLSTDLVFYDNFENPKKIKNNSVDCILGMGAFFYAKNFKKTISKHRNKLKKNGRLIFSLRNRLFDITSLNNYTKKFLDEIKIKIYPNKKYPTSQEYKKILYDSWSDNETKLLNIQSLIFDEYENLTNSEDARKLGFEVLQNKAKLFFEFVCEELGSNKPLNIDDLKQKLNTYL